MPIFGITTVGAGSQTATVPTFATSQGLAGQNQLMQMMAAQTASSTTLCTNVYSMVSGTNSALYSAGTNSSAIWISQGSADLQHAQYMALAQQRVVICRERTAAEVAAEQAITRRRLEEEKRRREQWEIARTRSQELLWSHLTPEQRRTLETNRWFIVQGGKSKTRYRIRDQGVAGNIDVMHHRKDLVVARLCCHCDSIIPAHDQLLAQKIHLQYDEERFLQTANKTMIAA